MQRTIRLEGRAVSYELERKRVKNINLRIRADGSVYVSAPRLTPQGEIERFIISKGEFVLRALDRFAEKTPLPRSFDEGERLSVLGREYELRVLPSAKNKATMGAGVITLYVRDPADAALREKTLNELLDALCAETVTGLCEEIYPLFEKRGVAYPEIKFRRMKSRWGSCAAAKGVLTFNKSLVYAPLSCVEYVVYHEFTHFLHPDHSPAFYECLARYVPDWKAQRRQLSDCSPYIKR